MWGSWGADRGPSPSLLQTQSLPLLLFHLAQGSCHLALPSSPPQCCQRSCSHLTWPLLPPPAIPLRGWSGLGVAAGGSKPHPFDTGD